MQGEHLLLYPTAQSQTGHRIGQKKAVGKGEDVHLGVTGKKD